MIRKRKDVITAREDRKERYQSLHTRQKDARAFYELTRNVDLPDLDGITLTRTKGPREKVMAGVHLYMNRNARCEVDPLKPTEASTNRAKKIETLHNYVLWLHKPLWREGFGKLLVNGVSVFKLWFDDAYYGVDKRDWKGSDRTDFAYRSLRRFPITFKNVDFLHCYPSSVMQTFHEPLDMIESYKMTVQEAVYLCEMNKWKKGKWARQDDPVEYTTYYDNKQRYVLMNDEPCFEGENLLKEVPYVVIGAGLGLSDYEGKPEYTYRDIIYDDTEMIESDWRMFSILNYALRKSSLPQTELIVEDVEEANAKLVNYTEKPDQAFVHDKSVERKKGEGEYAVNPQIFDLISLIRSSSGVPTALLGRPVANTYSEIHYSAQAAYARAQYETPLDNYELGIAELLGMAAKAIKWLDIPVAVKDVNPRESKVETVDADDIDHYECRVKFVGDTPEQRDMKQNMGMAILRQKVMPYVDVMIEYFDTPREVAERMEEDLVLEKIRELPQWVMSMGLEVADQRGMDRSMQMIANEMVQMGMEIPPWAQVKLGMQQPDAEALNAQLPRGGDHRQPAELSTARESVPLHGDRGATGVRPTET